MRTPVSIGIVAGNASARALGHALADLPDAEVRAACGLTAQAPMGTRNVADIDELVDDDIIDAVVVGAAFADRAGLVRKCLEADKHVLIAGHLSPDAEEVAGLVRDAADRARSLMCVSESVHRPATARLRALLDEDILGDLFYVRASHCDQNAAGDVLWTLGADEVSLVLSLLSDEPLEVAAHGDSYVGGPFDDILLCHMRFATGITAQLQLSALECQVERCVTLVGSRSTAMADDRPGRNSVRIQATPVRPDIRPPGLELEPGDTRILAVQEASPFMMAAGHFIRTIRTRNRGPSHELLAVAATLDALNRSRRNGGAIERLGSDVREPTGRVVALPRTYERS